MTPTPTHSERDKAVAIKAPNVDSDGKRLPRTIHVALSVDVDRFSDSKLRRQYDGILIREDGSRVSWRDLRALCREYRAKGFEVFPPCDNVNERGFCRGHGPDDVSPPPQPTTSPNSPGGRSET